MKKVVLGFIRLVTSFVTIVMKGIVPFAGRRKTTSKTDVTMVNKNVILKGNIILWIYITFIEQLHHTLARFSKENYTLRMELYLVLDVKNSVTEVSESKSSKALRNIARHSINSFP